MAEKVTVMVLKVDLQCPCCYKEVKKILCKFPQIRDRKFDEKGNKVTITMVCCNPEKIRDDLSCKGAKVIKCIEIVKLPPPPPAKQDPDPKTKPTESSKEDKPIELVMYPYPFPMYPLCYPVPVKTCCGPCSEGYSGGPCYFEYGHGRACHVTRCNYYFTEENPQVCSIM